VDRDSSSFLRSAALSTPAGRPLRAARATPLPGVPSRCLPTVAADTSSAKTFSPTPQRSMRSSTSLPTPAGRSSKSVPAAGHWPFPCRPFAAPSPPSRSIPDTCERYGRRWSPAPPSSMATSWDSGCPGHRTPSWATCRFTKPPRSCGGSCTLSTGRPRCCLCSGRSRAAAPRWAARRWWPLNSGRGTISHSKAVFRHRRSRRNRESTRVWWPSPDAPSPSSTPPSAGSTAPLSMLSSPAGAAVFGRSCRELSDRKPDQLW